MEYWNGIVERYNEHAMMSLMRMPCVIRPELPMEPSYGYYVVK